MPGLTKRYTTAIRTSALLTAATTLLACTATPPRYEATSPDVPYPAVAQLEPGTPVQVVSYGPDALQYAELWLPEQADAVPVVAFIHGGCWLNAYDIAHTRPFTTALADAGFAVWSIEYRRTGDAGGGWPGSYEDIQAALAMLAKQQNPQLDLSRVALLGHSAGGHLALLAGTNAPAQLDVDAVIGLAAITDLPAYARGDNSCESVTAAFMGGLPDAIPALYQQANPAAQQAHPQTILIHGRADKIVSAEQAQLEGATTVWVEDAGHFDMIHPGAPVWQQIVDVLEKSLQEEAAKKEADK
ncbi:alpha/beta hydrolase [Pseudidiomarina sp.]|uniref:alpha/beta hydrolase n=1 Tax=Pseudidiomarina sp. TaxID=2081707 RepID=UPI00299F4B6D|nr:alpha/beta hydrolase [Pseudidiomarina sp.]MDX1705578.1 alpha/beta hydrolase [Pseudidiomarina sp.]